MTQEKAIERNHSLKITSGDLRGGRDIDDIGKFVMTNGVTGKEHELTMWTYGLATDQELVDIDIYTTSPGELMRMTDEGMDIDDAYYHSAKQKTLSDFITTEDELKPAIRTYTFNRDANYEYDIPTTELKVDLHDLIVKEEIGDLIIKHEKGFLTKEDVLDFGKLVKGDDTCYALGSKFKEPIQNILREHSFTAGEIATINSASKTLKADIDFRSLVVSKEELQNMKLPGAMDSIEKAYPKEFLEKFQEVNAIEPKLVLHEDRETGLIAMGILMEKESLDSDDEYEFVQLSNMEMSSFDYNAAISKEIKEGKDIGNLHVESLAERSKDLYSQKNMMTCYGISTNEAKEFVLENSQVSVVGLDKAIDYIDKNGIEPELDFVMASGLVKLNYELGTGRKNIELEEVIKDSQHSHLSYDLNGEERPSPYYDTIPTRTTFYELNEKELAFIDAKTNKEYPLEKILSEQEFQSVKDSVESRESISFNLDSEHVENIKDLTKHHDKSFSPNKLLNNSKEEIEHSR